MSMNKKNLYHVFFTTLLALSVKPLSATVYSKLELQQLAIDFVMQQKQQVNVIDTNSELTINALPLDSRIEQRECHSDLALSAANPITGNRQSTIKIKCFDKNNWQVFVHTKQVELIEIITASQGISKGQIITPALLQKKKVAKHLSRSNQVKDFTALVGSRSKRNIRAGQAINYNSICSVCKGDSVTILVNYRGMTIKTQGEALQDGRVGDNIRVINTQSGKKIKAQVTNTQQVRVAI